VPERPGDDDAWYAGEESTRAGLVIELQRLRRRARARPWPVIVLAAALTVVIVFRIATRPERYHAEVVLAMSEGAYATKRTGIPLAELREFVDAVMLADTRLVELIERHDLHPLRRKLGMQYAIAELRAQIAVDVWRNTFVYFDFEVANPEHTARIGITVVDGDPDLAFVLARDLADLVIAAVRAHRNLIAGRIAAEVAELRRALDQRLGALELERAELLVAFTHARRLGKEGLAQAVNLQLHELDREQKQAETTLVQIAQSNDTLIDRVSAAGLDLIVEVADERRPERRDDRELVLVVSAVLVALGALLGSALLVGAFDSRVHDTDDVARLGLPVLGHVPRFPGDRSGALEARGVQRPRVPMFSRWRT
jgi:hypothetical protein